MRNKLHNANAIKPVVVKHSVQCSSCGSSIGENNWCLRVNSVFVHDNGVCIEVYKCKHGLAYNKFAVSMRLSMMVME